MKKIISVIVLALLLDSCVTRQACEKRFATIKSDSISSSTNTVTIIQDTTIYVNIPGDTVEASKPITDTSRLITPMAISSVWVKNGKLKHRLEQKTTSLPTTIKGALKTNITLDKKVQTIVRTRYTNQLSGWQWTQVYLGRVFMAALIVIVLWNVLKRNLN